MELETSKLRIQELGDTCYNQKKFTIVETYSSNGRRDLLKELCAETSSKRSRKGSTTIQY